MTASLIVYSIFSLGIISCDLIWWAIKCSPKAYMNWTFWVLGMLKFVILIMNFASSYQPKTHNIIIEIIVCGIQWTCLILLLNMKKDRK